MGEAVAVEAGGRLPSMWSATAVAGYHACGLRFWFARVAGWREPDTAEQVAGRVVHGVLEDLYRRPADDRDPGLLPGLLDTRLAALPAAAGVDPRQVSDLAIDRLRAFLVVEPDPARVDVLADGLERKVTATLSDVPFLGYVDRLGRCDVGTRITDYKTGGSHPDRLPGALRQQYLYAAALAENGEPVDEVELLHLGTDPRSVVRPVYPAATERALRDLGTAAAGAAAAFAAAVWPASPGPLCRTCPFRRCCPATGRGASRPGSPDCDNRLTAAGLHCRGPDVADPAADVAADAGLDPDDVP